MQRHPSVRVSLDERWSRDVVRSVLDGSADLGVYWDAIAAPNLEVFPYRADRLVVLVHKEHALARRKRVSFIETLPYEQVAIKGGGVTQLTQQRLAIAEGLPLKHHVQVGSFDAACRIVAANLGIAIVPQQGSLALIKGLGLKVVGLTDGWASRHFVVCARERSELTAPARLLLDMLSSQWYEPEATRP